MQQMNISSADAGQRLDKYIHKVLPNAPMSFVYKMLRKKNITLNKKKAEGKEILKVKDSVEMFFSEDTFQKFSYSDEQLQADIKMYQQAYEKYHQIPVIYEDEEILILNKPAGLLSQKATVEGSSVNEWMIGYLLKKNHITTESLKMFHPSVCNRLDRNTSGLLLCGKSLKGSQLLAEILKHRSLHKYYITFVSGSINEPKHLTGYLSKDEKTNKVTVLSDHDFLKKEEQAEEVREQYDYIETACKPLGYDESLNITALEVQLITGKSHQIRAHLAAIGHPLIGDHKYGSDALGYKYQLLHAYRMEFPEIMGELSYLSGKIFMAPLPAEFHKLEEKICPHGIPEA